MHDGEICKMGNSHMHSKWKTHWDSSIIILIVLMPIIIIFWMIGWILVLIGNQHNQTKEVADSSQIQNLCKRIRITR